MKAMPSETVLNPAVRAALVDSTPRLVDSLVHEARNPLNAIAINVEVLTDKLRQAALLGGTEKYLRAMRDQVFRVDGILRRFADFLAPRPSGEAEVNLSHVVEAAVQVAGHEARKNRVGLAVEVEPELRSSLSHACSVYFLTLQPILRAIGRAGADSQVQISLSRQPDAVLFVVRESGPGVEDGPDLAPVLDELSGAIGGSASVRGGECRVTFPLRARQGG